MKITVLGAGAMGSLYGTYLSENNDVVLIDSYRPLVDSINEHGLTRLEKDGQELHFAGIRAEMSGMDIGIQDLIIVFVKSIHTYDVISENLNIIGPDTIVMTLQNGAGNNREIAKFVKKENIIVGTSSHNSVSQGLGKIFHSGCGPTNIGPDYPCDISMGHVKAVSEVMQQSGMEVHVIKDIQKVLWGKLFVNCGLNALSTIMQCKLGEIRSKNSLWDICTSIVEECILVAKADGTEFSRDEVLTTVGKVSVNDAEGFASMYQDRQHKRKTEIDKINGVVAELGRGYGIPTPYNNMIVELIHGIEDTYTA